MVLSDASKEENKVIGGLGEEGDDSGGLEGGKTKKADVAPEEGNDSHTEGRKGRKDKCPHLQFQKYKEAVENYYLQYTDSNLVSHCHVVA